MGKIEREFLWTQDKIPQKWWSFTDDTFAIWTHGEPSLKVFIYNPNHHHSSIKFTVSWSAKGVTFLKTRVYLRDGLIGNDLHIKPTDIHQHLQMDICNARHCKTSIPYSQALRLHQTCSEEEYLLNCTRELKKHLLNEGIVSCNQITISIKHLLYQEKTVCNHNRTKISLLKYRWWSHTIQYIIFSINHQAPLSYPTYLKITTRSILTYPSLIAIQSSRNLRDFLVQAALNVTHHETPCNHPCQAAGCKTCLILTAIDEFTTHTTGQKFNIINLWPPVSPPILFIK